MSKVQGLTSHKLRDLFRVFGISHFHPSPKDDQCDWRDLDRIKFEAIHRVKGVGVVFSFFDKSGCMVTHASTFDFEPIEGVEMLTVSQTGDEMIKQHWRLVVQLGEISARN